MRNICLIFYFLVSLNSYGQQKAFKSLATEYLSSGQIEWIERDIIFSDSLITIKTITDSTTDTQKFLIIESGKDKFQELGMCKYYRCTSTDGKVISTFYIPNATKIERIEALVPNQPGAKPQHYRFHID